MLFPFTSLVACPIYYLGKIKIVDEDFKELDSGKLFRLFSNDKFYEYKKSFRKDWGDVDSTDGMDFRIWSRGDYYNKTPIEYNFKVSAEGYADLYIKDLYLKRKSWKDSLSVHTVLYIVLPRKKFVTVEGKIQLKTSYKLDEICFAKDTAVLDVIGSSSKNVKVMGKEGEWVEMFNTLINKKNDSDNTTFATETYPNPVTNSFHVNIPNIYELGQKISFLDVQGKEVKSLVLYQDANTLDLHWLKSGTYIVIIYDENGNGIHQERLIKL